MAGNGMEAGASFGKYKIVRLLGQGGMGAVYEAIHTGLRKQVAIKALLPEMAAVPEARARFLREGEAASRIRHPHAVEVFDVGEENGVPFLVMEFLSGQSLDERLSGSSLTVNEAVDIMIPVIAAVAAGHDQGVVHRDLKPANLFPARDGHGEILPKVLDFGVSKITSADNKANLTGTLSVLGTAAYMSPEQAMGSKSVGPASDQYALGLILYEVLTGKRVHDGDNPLAILHNIISGSIDRPSLVRSGLDVA